tara:strand:- start:333 stop:1001 length:669 start_codon:yes stop_codon:yes gene_type:complete
VSFSKEWDDIYKASAHLSVWPWSDLVSLVKRHVPSIGPGTRVLEIGCGAGANVPFFQSLGVDYCAVEGSPSIVAQLQAQYPEIADRFVACDFTETLHFDGPFDVAIDRGSLPHNSDAGIRKTVSLAYDALRPGGKLISVDLCSDQHYGATSGTPCDDTYTRKDFTEGALAGTGRVHFADKENLLDIFADWNIETLMHKRYDPVTPDTGFVLAFWNMVAEKPA